ncbi:hypothetical protein E6O75_ATG01001 [Venturia nashicola]|uniref:Uncharacterized protein n=1 Tax=Venturia nashicola TaxID=86259 RepID=A0A4Z1PAU7_9PEZI|nr:hypothetical protein E6O75_ATG01001 [Venturia nashicola]
MRKYPRTNLHRPVQGHLTFVLGGKAAIPSSKPMSQLYPLYAFLFNAPGSHGGAGMILLTAVGQVTSNYQP